MLFGALLVALIPIPISLALQSGAEKDVHSAKKSISGLDRLTYLSTTISGTRLAALAFTQVPSAHSEKVFNEAVDTVITAAARVPSSQTGDLAKVHVAVHNLEKGRDRLIHDVHSGLSSDDAMIPYDNVIQTESGEVVSSVAVSRAQAGTKAQDRLLTSLHSKLRSVRLIAGFAGLVLFIGAWFLPVLLSRRLERLVDATRDVAAGYYDASIDGYGDDEVGRLAQSFQAMAVSLQLRASENSYLLDAQVERATRDSLTGLRNNRFFYETLNALLSASRRPVSVAIFDLDNFKSVNDTYGHAEGDTVLKRVAEAAGSSIRRTDVMCRLGGEEFGIIFPESETIDCRPIMEKVAKALRATDPEGRKTTFSCGIASSVGGAARELFERADEGAYEAKRAGKDRIVLVDQQEN